MITAAFIIRFDFLVEGTRVNIPLEAEVYEHHSDLYYKISNINIPGRAGHPVLPEMTIRKENGQWVHTDSGKATELSTAAGLAIDDKNR